MEVLVAEWPNGRIPRRVSLSTKAVANYVSTILAKLQLADRPSAIVAARGAGLGVEE